MIYFEAGDRIPADARILEANGLSLDESSLTGENKPVYKTPEVIEAHPALDLDSFGPSWHLSPEQLLNVVHVPRIPLAERKNIAYMGTLVSSGNGRAVVIATGPHSELGQICGLMKEVDSIPSFLILGRIN
jgi:Ca2+-transporting ATPase